MRSCSARGRWSRAARAAAVLCSILALTAPSLAAQTILGTVVEAGSDRPLAGVWVSLVDGDGERVAGRISDPDGRFLILAPTAGRFSIHAERIGFRTVRREGIELEAGETLSLRLEASIEAISLEGLVARTERRCVLRPQDGGRTAALWDEARKALDAVAHADREGVFRYQVRMYERSLDLPTLQVRSETARGAAWHAAVPFESLPAEALARDGFIQEREDGTFFYAPDAAVLLSDAFLDTHCFRARPGPPDAPELVGLAFEPVPGRRTPSIEGALWLDARTAELRYADFRYVGAPGPRHAHVGGRVDFERLPTGAWIVPRWWIRMPEIVVHESRLVGGGVQLRETVDGITETGAIVEGLRGAGGLRVLRTQRGVLRGTLRVAGTYEPVPGATIYLVGTVYSSQTDADGRFRLDGLYEGRYAMTFSHPRYDLFRYRAAPVPVELEPGSELQVDLVAPGPRDLIDAACPGGARGPDEEDRGVLVGTVRAPGAGAALAGARVRATWARYTAIEVDGIDGDVLESVAISDQRGHYRLCGLPVDVPVAVRASRPGEEPGPIVRVLLETFEPGHAELTLPAARGPEGRHH